MELKRISDETHSLDGGERGCRGGEKESQWEEEAEGEEIEIVAPVLGRIGRPGRRTTYIVF